jgi:hypothetical protein
VSFGECNPKGPLAPPLNPWWAVSSVFGGGELGNGRWAHIDGKRPNRHGRRRIRMGIVVGEPDPLISSVMTVRIDMIDLLMYLSGLFVP